MKLPDLLVVVTVMLAVTYLGHRLSGSITNRRGFFQADGSLPWWAVSASIIATVVSAVTFVSVPAAVFADGGDLTYFQVILGLAAGKVVENIDRLADQRRAVRGLMDELSHRTKPLSDTLRLRQKGSVSLVADQFVRWPTYIRALIRIAYS